MDYKKFSEQLPSLYENWGDEYSGNPQSNKFQPLIEHFQEKTTLNIMQLLNLAVDCMETGEIYCELGCGEGANLVAALLGHPDTLAYAVDNFYQYENSEENLDKLYTNLSNFQLEEQVFVCNQDFAEFFFDIRDFETANNIGLYFCNGTNNYRNQLLSLLLVRPFLANQSLIVIGNSNNSAVNQGIWDFIASHPQSRMLLDLPTQKDCHATFGKGIKVLSWDINQEKNYEFSEIKGKQNEIFIKRVANWHIEFENQLQNFNKLRDEALTLLNYGCYEEAETKYQELLKWDANQADVLLNLGSLYLLKNRYQEAINVLLKAIELDPATAIHHYTIGLVLEKINSLPQAIQAYQTAISLDPKMIDAYNNLGNILFNAGELEQAEAIYRQAIAVDEKHFGSYLNLGNILVERQQFDEAIEIYEKALNLKPRHPDILYNLGVVFNLKHDSDESALYFGYAHYRKGEYQEAINYYQQFLSNKKTAKEDLYICLADCYENLRQYQEAVNTYKVGIQKYPQVADLYIYLSLTLVEYGKIEEAISTLNKAVKIIPSALNLQIHKQLLLPIIYKNEVEIDDFRQRFSQGLDTLINHTSLDNPEAIKNAVLSVGQWTNFYLQYQGKNDLELQIKYGEFIHKVMAANYPDLVKPLPMPSILKSRKIRVGYISNYMCLHTVGKLMLGWIKNSNQQEFNVYCYYTGKNADRLTRKYQLYSNTFYHINGDMEAVYKQIIADKLDILVFLDIGMYTPMMQIAGLRLAPVQCVTWGHPITTGIPSIDYFLSSDLMEPENAQEHYSEQLVRLPNISICYEKPVIPQSQKTRADFVDPKTKRPLRDDAVIYLSCQSLYKYLPQFDYVFPLIAQKISKAQFAFLYHFSDHITDIFRQRLQVAFAEYGLNSEDYCVILPRQNFLGYSSLNLISDIYLDTLSWSGGNTTLEAIACNLPIVTCPGEFMRGRHSAAILKMLGVTDTIAANEAEYINIAVRLGLDSEWRQSIVERIAERHSYLYDDKTCVTALEDFYRRVVYKNQ